MKSQTMEFFRENLNELSSSKEKTEKKSLSFSNESSSGSIISPSNFLDLYELSNNLKLLNGISGMAQEKHKALEHPYPSIKEKIEKYGYDR